jgi:demethylmenaquinone methyltransferase / 2-methoxy-6-polyprenyl-1,4-benzoquinol methylase
VKRSASPSELRLDGAERSVEQAGDGLGVHVLHVEQCDHLALCCGQRVHRAPEVGVRWVRVLIVRSGSRTCAGQGSCLSGQTTPPRHGAIDHAAFHPRHRVFIRTDVPPLPEGSGEGVLRQVLGVAPTSGDTVGKRKDPSIVVVIERFVRDEQGGSVGVVRCNHAFLLAPPLRRVPSSRRLFDVTRPAWDTETLLQGDEKARAVRQMFDAVAPRYDLVNRIMTFRLDTRWRRRAVRQLALAPGSTVIDLASGTGDLCVDLRRFGHRPLSFDFSFGMLAADRSGAPRAQADVLTLPLADAAVDGATCGFALRNLRDLNAFFVELARVVRPGGRIALLDVGVPRNALVRFGNGIYFGKIVPKIGALLSDAPAYRYLPKSVAYLPAPDEMVAMLRHAGFGDARHQQLSGGITQLLTGTRTSTS